MIYFLTFLVAGACAIETVLAALRSDLGTELNREESVCSPDRGPIHDVPVEDVNMNEMHGWMYQQAVRRRGDDCLCELRDFLADSKWKWKCTTMPETMTTFEGADMTGEMYGGEVEKDEGMNFHEKMATCGMWEEEEMSFSRSCNEGAGIRGQDLRRRAEDAFQLGQEEELPTK